MAHRHIYLVDDEEPVRRSSSLMLKVAGYGVTTYESGRQFLNDAGNLMPGCLLLDVRMPEMDGIAVQAALKSKGVDFPVIMLTGHGDMIAAVTAFQAGAMGFLEKPFSRAVLLEAIRIAFMRVEDPEGFQACAAGAATAIDALPDEARSVIASLCLGQSSDVIARQLGKSVAGVEVVIAQILGALGVSTITEAIQIAFRAGMATSTSQKQQ